MLTLTEAAKLIQNPLQRGVVETFPRTSPVLERIPFLEVAGNAYQWNQEKTLPGVAFRGYNETYTESTGVVQNMVEALKVFGGTSKVDRALVKTQGKVNQLRAVQDSMKAKACALDWTKAFFKGDSTADANAFDGLEQRLVNGQVIGNSTAKAGAALTLAKLDELCDAVTGRPDVLFMNKAMRRKVNDLVRAANQATEVVSDSFGRPIYAYAGIPIGEIEEDASGNSILGFTEGNPAATDKTGTSSTSIYAVKFGVQEYCSGLQAGTLEVIDQGLVDVWYQTLVEWICSFALFHPKAAARLCGISNA